MSAKIIRFPAYADLRKPPEPTLWERIARWFSPPPKAEVFKIRNPRLLLELRRRARK